MKELYDINVIKDVMGRHGFSFSKSLGQNFIIDPGVCPMIAEMSGADENTGVIEIGPGIGVLTAELAKRAGKVVSVELDKRLLPVLAETLSDFDNVETVNDDILKIDLKKLIKEKFSDMRVIVCANLPYYITSPVIMLLLESGLPVDSITVMVQKEAGDRICAPVGSRDSGAVTAAVNFYAESKKLFDVSRECFMPSPKVDSTVIQLTLRKEPLMHLRDEKRFFRLIRSAFEQRRKTAANSISSGMGLDKQTVIASLERAGFSPDIRAEKFTMDDFKKLYDELETVL